MVVGAVLFFVTQVMAAGSPSPVLMLEDCDGFRQADQQVIETATQTQNSLTGDTSGQLGLGGGGAPREPATGEPATGEPATGEPATGEPATGDDANLWEIALDSGECPARKPN